MNHTHTPHSQTDQIKENVRWPKAYTTRRPRQMATLCLALWPKYFVQNYTGESRFLFSYIVMQREINEQ